MFLHVFIFYSVIEEPSVVKEISITKQRRFKASQIPSKPVEMPSGIDELSYEVRTS